MTRDNVVDFATATGDASEYASTKENDFDAIMRLAKLPPLEFDRRCREEAVLLCVRPETLRAEVRKKRKSNKPGATHAKQAAPNIAELELSARDIIESDNVLGLFEAAWSRSWPVSRRPPSCFISWRPRGSSTDALAGRSR